MTTNLKDLTTDQLYANATAALERFRSKINANRTLSLTARNGTAGTFTGGTGTDTQAAGAATGVSYAETSVSLAALGFTK